MSTVCERQFVLTVGVATPSAYWKFEEASGSRDDSVGNQPWIHTQHNDLGNATGKIGNGMYFPGGLASSTGYDLDYNVDPMPDFDPSGPGITVCYWWKPTVDGTFLGYLSNYYGFYGVVLWRRLYKDRYYLQLQGITSDSLIDISYPWVSGQWYFVVEQFRTINNKVRFCVNNGAWTEATDAAVGFGGVFPTYGSLNVGLGVGGAKGVLDEMGVWMNTVFSDADVAAVYNAGVGRTWP